MACETSSGMGSTKVHFDNASLVHLLCGKFISDIPVGDAEVTEGPFAATRDCGNTSVHCLRDVRSDFQRFKDNLYPAVIEV